MGANELDEPIELSKDRKVSIPIALIMGAIVVLVAATRWVDSKLMVIDSVPSLAAAVTDLTRKIEELDTNVRRLASSTERLTETLNAEARAALPASQLPNRRPATVQAGGRREDVRKEVRPEM